MTSYDTRPQIVDAAGTQQQTADDKQVIVEAYAVWRVSNPLVFYRILQRGPDENDHYAEAKKTVNSSLNSAISETSRFRMDEPSRELTRRSCPISSRRSRRSSSVTRVIRTPPAPSRSWTLASTASA